MIGMHAIRKKLQSRRGASLTFALLLFLVCAVVGSLVLVAGTAAAGRLKGLGESEQRFQAVNSAAEMVTRQLCDGDDAITVGIRKNADGTYSYILPSTEPAGKALAYDLAKCLVFGNTNVAETDSQSTKEGFYNGLKDEEAPSYTFKNPKTFYYEVSAEGIPTLMVKVEFINGYQLNLTVQNLINDGETGPQYTVPILLETTQPRGANSEDKAEFTFKWRPSKGGVS